MPFDRAPIDLPYTYKRAYASPSGVIAWDIASPNYGNGSPSDRCPDPMIVQSTDGHLWQLPGNMILDTAAVSADGLKVAFAGTFKPPGTGFLATQENTSRWITGIHLADAKTGEVKLILWEYPPPPVISISWAPSGRAFAYDLRGVIYIYDLERGISRPIAEGRIPEWAPDGNSIAFISMKDEATLIDVSSMKTQTLRPGHKIDGDVQWSPDSRYLMFSEPGTFWGNIFHGIFPIEDIAGRIVIYRIADKASIAFYPRSSHCHFWVSDYRMFLRNAASPLPVHPCDQGNKLNHDRAIQDYDQAIQLDPKNFGAFYERAVAYLHKGNYERAIQDFDQVIRLNLTFAPGFDGRGMAYYEKGDYDRAIQDFDQAIRLNPDYALAFASRGEAYNKKGDQVRAMQDYDQAIQLDPNDSTTFNNRGSTYFTKGSYDRAIQDYDQAIRLDPSNSLAFGNRAAAYGEKGESDRAFQDFDQAIRLDPNYAEAFYNRGSVELNIGDYNPAIRDFDQAIRLKPNYSEALYRRGLAYSKKGN